MNERSDEEQRLADLLKRAVPEPPRQLTHEEITMRHLERSVKPWLMPAMAAASVLVIGGAIGAVAATRPNPAPPRASAASQGNRAAGGQQEAGAQQTAPGCPGTATPVPSPSPGSPSPFPTAPPGGNVTVPRVTGLTVSRAEQVLRHAGLFVFTQTAPAHGAPAGTVLRQLPAAGTRAPSGAVVVIIVAIKTSGPVPMASPAPSATAIPIPSASPIPSVTAAPSPYLTCPASASPVPSSAPSSSPSVVPTVTPAPVTSAPASPVPSSTPIPAPTSAPAISASVTASPTSAADVTVPDVVGMQELSAQSVLQQAGFNVLVVTNAPEPSGQPRGTVFRQSPAPGSAVPRGSQITIYG